MNQKKCRIEFRYYEKPAGTYILPKIGEGWEIHYGADTRGTLHYHNLFEFGYCYHGGGLLVIGDQRHHYSDDCFTAIPANIPHTTESDPGRFCKWEFLFVDMNAFIEEQMGDLRMSAAEIERIVNAHGTMKTMEHHRRLGVLIRQMIEECRNQEAHYEESLRGYLRATVIELLRLSEERAMRFRGTSHERYIESALEYIDKHYQEDLRIEDLANVCGLSESHFRRAFEESTNMRPIEYLNMVRVNRACRFLLMEDLSMTDVAYRTGFQTASSFNRNFKRITGSTPLQWKLKALRDGSMKQRFHISAMKGWEAEEWKDRRGPGKENLD